MIPNVFQETVFGDMGASPVIMGSPQARCSLLQTLHPPHKTDTLRFSPNSALVLSSSSWFGTVALWRTKTGKLEHIIQVDRGSKIAFLPDSDHLISVSREGIVKVWSISTGACLQESSLSLSIDAHSNSTVESSVMRSGPSYNCNRPEGVIALSPNGDLIASFHRTTPDKEIIIQVWESRTSHCACEIGPSDISAPPLAAFSPNSELIALVYQNSIKIYCPRTGQEVRHLDYSRDGSALVWAGGPRPAFSADSKLFTVMGKDVKLCIWSTGTWERLHWIEEVTQTASSCFGISPDSAVLAASAPDGLKLRSIETGNYIAKVTGHTSLVTFSPDWTASRLLASRDYDVVQIWHADISQPMSE